MLEPTKPISLELKDVLDTGGETPKFNAKYDGKEYKVKFAVEMPAARTANTPGGALRRTSFSGMEILSENFVNRVASCLGYTIDPTYYKKKVHVYLDTGPKRRESTEAYQDRFERSCIAMINQMRRGATSDVDVRSSLLFDNALQDVQFDSSGRGYLVVEEASLELRGKAANGDSLKAGLFTKEGSGRADRREYRALGLLSALMADRDTKASNSDLRLIPKEDGSYKIGFSLSEMGATLAGNVFGKSNANEFNPNLVSKVTATSVETTYATAHWQPIYGKITMDDARWLTRRLAQLTPEQIHKAAIISGATPAESKLFEDKLLRRRDQLVASLLTVSGPDSLKVMTDSSQKPLAIATKTSSMTDPLTYNPKGFEQYIKNGRLVEIDEARIDGGNKATPKLSTELIRAWRSQLIASGVNAAGQWLQYAPLGRQGVFGGQKTAIDSDLKGVPTFACLPARYNIPNKGNVAMPWLVVDVYHVGVGAGAAKTGAAHDSRFDASTGFLKEVVRIRPSKTKNTNLDEILANFKNTCNPVKLEQELDEASVNSMNPGDKLMVNKYRYAGTGFTGNLMNPNGLISPDLYL
jgi:hypothetical protein